MESCRSRRPNRSDVRLSREEEDKIEGQAREYFEGIAPKRHSKPQRSDYSSTYVDDNGGNDDRIPEFQEFRRLEDENDPPLVYTNSKAEDEFMETEYYKDLNCIDKQHHRTGTGFISTGDGEDNRFRLAPDASDSHHSSCKGNPATNDWIPSSPDVVTFVASDKPNRSDN